MPTRVRRSASVPSMLLAILFAGIGLALAFWLTGLWWGVIFPVVLPALVPLLTQRREIKAVASEAAQAAGEAVRAAGELADAPYREDAPRSHTGFKRWAISLALIAAMLVLAGVQLATKQEDGWWWVAACAPLMALFVYAAFQWCRGGTVGRTSMFAAAAFAAGLAGNFTAGALTSAACARHAENALAAPLRPVTEGIAYLVNWTKKKDARDAEADERQKQILAAAQETLAATQRYQKELDEIKLRLATSTRDGASSSPPALTTADVSRLEEIKAKGTPLQQADAIILLAADARSAALWAEADAAITRVEADRARGLWKSPADEERYLLLKGDRLLFADDPDGAIAPYQASTAAFPNSARAWNQLGGAQANARQGDTKAQWAAAQRAYEMGLHVASDDPRLIAALHSNLALIQRDQGDLPGARASMEKAIAIDSRHFAPDHPNFAIRYSNLAGIQQDQGDLPGARASMEKAITIAEKYLGADHPTLATLRSNLAMIKKDQDDLPGARASLERAITIDQKHLAPDHPNFGIRYTTLATICYHERDRTGACANLKKALTIFRKHFPDTHPHIQSVLQSMQAAGCTP